jgi:uncharacterized membrane protein
MGWRALAGRACGKQAVMVFFLLCALPVTVLTALVVPPCQSPDEMTHYARALGLIHGAVVALKRDALNPETGKMEQQVGVLADLSGFKVSLGSVTELDNRPVVTLDNWSKMETVPSNHDLGYIDLPNTATYFPAAYVPGALGAAAGQYIFGMTPLHCFIMARLFMASAFLLTGLATLYVAAYGEALLLAVLLLPMTLFLSGTMNEDGLLIAMTCLAVACLTRATRGGRIAGLILFALVLGAKPPFILLMGVFALPLFTPGFWRRFFDMAVAMLPVLGWIVFISLFVVVPYGKIPYHPGPLYAGDHSVLMDHANARLQLQVLLDRPRRFLALPYYSTIESLYTDYIMMIGVLGPLQIVLDPGIYDGWSVAVICAALGLLFASRPETAAPRVALVNFIAVMAAIGVTYWVLEITFYLDWTNVGQPDIDGIQGRYLLIFLPFLLIAIPNLQSFPGLLGRRFALPPLLPALPAVAMGLYDIGYIPLKMVLNYYLH